MTFTVSSSSGLNTEHKHFFNNIFICVLGRFSDSLSSPRATLLVPAKISKKEKYGYEVEWADGATIIYSLLAIAKQLEESHLRVDIVKLGCARLINLTNQSLLLSAFHADIKLVEET